MKITINSNELVGQLCFSPSAIEAYWTALSPKEKIDLLLVDKRPTACMFTNFARKDPSDYVRMLAHSPLHTTRLNQEDFISALKDTSPIVRAAAWAHKEIDFALGNLDHEGRLTMMALRNECCAIKLIDFIKNEIQNDESLISNNCRLLSTYCRNKFIMALFIEPDAINDGIDFIVAKKYFEALWNFAANSPRDISDVLAWELPLGENWNFIKGIPESAIKDNVEMTLAWRQYKPLLEKIKSHPELFSPEVINASNKRI